MAGEGFARFKYKHGQGGGFFSLLAGSWVKRILLMGFAPLFFILPPVAPAFLVIGGVILVGLVVRAGQQNGLLVGPRYLICGKIIVYYRNLQRVQISAGGRLELQGAHGKRLCIEQKKFPTDARKAHKIEANTKAKLDKVCDRIFERVQAQAPEVEFVGVSKPRPEGNA